MKATTNLIKFFCDMETDKSLVGRKCKIKPEVLKKYKADGCKEHAKLCSGILTIIATQKNYQGNLAVRVQNEKIKNIHPGCGDLLNSFIKDLDEIILIEEKN